MKKLYTFLLFFMFSIISHSLMAYEMTLGKNQVITENSGENFKIKIILPKNDKEEDKRAIILELTPLDKSYKYEDYVRKSNDKIIISGISDYLKMNVLNDNVIFEEKIKKEQYSEITIFIYFALLTLTVIGLIIISYLIRKKLS